MKDLCNTRNKQDPHNINNHNQHFMINVVKLFIINVAICILLCLVFFNTIASKIASTIFIFVAILTYFLSFQAIRYGSVTAYLDMNKVFWFSSSSSSLIKNFFDYKHYNSLTCWGINWNLESRFWQNNSNKE